jgi:hypothetical protein
MRRPGAKKPKRFRGVCAGMKVVQHVKLNLIRSLTSFKKFKFYLR